jgi:pteridine reductase
VTAARRTVAADRTSRRVLVVGATGTIGSAIGSALLARGDSVVALGRNDGVLKSMSRGLPARCRKRLQPVIGDLTLPGAIERMAELALQGGAVDDLVISFGPFERTPLKELSHGTIARLVFVHAEIPILLVKTLQDSLAASGGAVVALSDQGLDRPYPNHAAYLAAKGALEGGMRALAVDLAPRVRVNVLRPGIVSDPESQEPARTKRLADRSLLRRLGSASEVARVVLAMLDAAWLSGQIWNVG